MPPAAGQPAALQGTGHRNPVGESVCLSVGVCEGGWVRPPPRERVSRAVAEGRRAECVCEAESELESVSYHTTHTTRAARTAEKQRQRRSASSGHTVQKRHRGRRPDHRRYRVLSLRSACSEFSAEHIENKRGQRQTYLVHLSMQIIYTHRYIHTICMYINGYTRTHICINI